MEELKVKTVKEILIEHSFHSYHDDKDLCFKISLEDGVKAMDDYASQFKSHITKLEAENEKMRNVLQVAHIEMSLRKDSNQSLKHLVEKTLNKKLDDNR